ncbi:glycosyltransferase [bacterium]|nr:glycosyltransferase [bacterium]
MVSGYTPNEGTILPQNLQIWSRKLQQDIELPEPSGEMVVYAEPAKRTGTTLFVNGNAIHSRYDPRKEASGLVEKLLRGKNNKNIILIGFGNGDLARAISEQHPGGNLIVIEPSGDVLACSLREIDQRELLEKITLLTNSSTDNSLDELTAVIGGKNEIEKADVIVAPFVRKYAPQETEELERRLRNLTRNQNQRYRILVVGPVYGGSLPIAGYVVNALNKLGHRVEYLDNSVFAEGLNHLEAITPNRQHESQLKSGFTNLLAETVTAKALAMRAQIVFFMAQSPATPEVLKELKFIGIPSAFWFVEDGRLMEYGLKIAPYFDVFFHIQKGWFEEELKRAGANVVHYLPLAADPDVHKPIDLSEIEKREFGSDLSHLGAGYFNRRHFFLSLLDYNFKLWGNDWQEVGALRQVLQRKGERIATEEVVKIFNATKININLHSSTYVEGVDPNGDFVNPRTFELAASGAFQLVDERLLLSEMFDTTSELATFRDVRSCRDQINYFLNHPEERQRFTQAAQQRVLEEHTYVHRMVEAIKVITEHVTPAFPETQLNTIGALLEEAADEPELATFLESLGPHDQVVTLEGIVTAIEEDEGELDDQKAIFLMMKELNDWAAEKGITTA